ncbi:adenosylcobinamide-GDP ribazoletransferase [Nocardioides mangrovicus]|uniref:Adenosylcobinamide-GDP ribazoletransferase n=1 Tax=Nocardioides mangrovicus TaxID=2478913 RepID=A0A3L8P614_9ACTN|nr:adenosylcobinamide-GDP ribazoletransferase [Nocardioides mangrovicus]
MLDAWRLAVGTLTALPVRPPASVDRRTARGAMLLAPVAVLPLGVAVWLVGWLFQRFDAGSPATGVAAIAVVVLGTRAFHLDGLADTADGLASSYDRERSLAVMKSGTSGPAGVAAVVLVLLLQVLAAGQLLELPHGPVVAGAAVCLSRTALWLTCAAGVPGARADGLGTPFVGSVPRPVAVAMPVVVVVVVVVLARWLGGSVGRGALTAVLAVIAVGLLVLRARRRFGGVTGDVYGAAIEVCLAIVLAGLAGGLNTVYVGSYVRLG